MTAKLPTKETAQGLPHEGEIPVSFPSKNKTAVVPFVVAFRFRECSPAPPGERKRVMTALPCPPPGPEARFRVREAQLSNQDTLPRYGL